VVLLFRNGFVTACLLLLGPLPIGAQTENSAVLTGTVTDVSDAVIAEVGSDDLPGRLRRVASMGADVVSSDHPDLLVPLVKPVPAPSASAPQRSF
jgi:hypothetical protein